MCIGFTPIFIYYVYIDAGDIHVIFSTDCTPFQDWQTLLVFHSAKAVGQQGAITRIASGCDEEKKIQLTALYAKLYPQYHVHFTPDFTKDGKTKESYAFYNKPYGLQVGYTCCAYTYLLLSPIPSSHV